MMARPSNPRRRGMIFIVVMGMMMVVVCLVVGALMAGRVRAKMVAASVQVSNARLAAQSGLELARLWINQDAQWRTTRQNGVWATNLPVGPGTVTIQVVDPLDNDLTNRPYDPVVVTATGYAGQAVRTLQETLVASPTPLPALAYALHAGGRLRVNSGYDLILGSATASTNTEFRNDSLVEGNAICSSSTGSGVCNGTITTNAPSRDMPDSSVITLYTHLATEITGVSTIQNQVLGPGCNPYGAPNADGVYLIRSSNDVIIRNTRICGTLVVLNPGKQLILDQAVLIDPARADFPAIVCTGDLVVQLSSSSLSESANGVNYNPLSVPYKGASNASMTDVYPNEVHGLVHTTGAFSVSNPATFRGAVIAEAMGSNAVQINANLTIAYAPALFTSPPQGYTTQVRMVVQGSSVKQTVN